MRRNLLLFLLSLSFCHMEIDMEARGHFCGVDSEPPIEFYQNEVPKNAYFDPDTHFTPYRIYFDYTKLNTQTDIQGEDYVNFIKQHLTQAKYLFEKIMNIRSNPGNLVLGETICNGLPTSKIVQTEGVPAVMVIIPFIDPNMKRSALASAVFCNYDPHPYTGKIRISLGLNSLSNFSEYLVALFMHEMTHIFVFHNALYKYFRNWNGKPYDKVTINGVQRTLLATPKIVAAARKHFGCDSIEGVELENQGGEGTVESHWEARVMLGDYMLGIMYNENFISDITMALFED